MANTPLENAGIWVAIITGAVPLAGVIVRKIYIRISNSYFLIRTFLEHGVEVPKKVDEMAAKMDALDAKVIDVIKEVKPNGGSSLRDAVARIEMNQYISDQQRRALLNLAPVPAFESDSTGECIWANRAYLRVVGKSLEEVLGFGWINHIAPNDQEVVRARWIEAIKDGRDFVLDYHILTVTGAAQLVHGQAFPIRDIKNQVIGYNGTMEARQ